MRNKMTFYIFIRRFGLLPVLFLTEIVSHRLLHFGVLLAFIFTLQPYETGNIKQAGVAFVYDVLVFMFYLLAASLRPRGAASDACLIFFFFFLSRRVDFRGFRGMRN